MSYRSPVEVAITQLRMEQEKKVEEFIFSAIQELEITINKEQLIKALRYDREQYKQGYEDGYEDGYDADKWISADGISRPDECGFYLVCAKDEIGYSHIRTAYYTTFGWGNINVTHWQPLPAPPKEVEDEMQY